LKNKGYQIIATTPHDDDCVMEDFDISKPSALFFGRNATACRKKFYSVPMVFLK
jgi:tRNA (guanosine-2'-O-)-methyltransferase